MAMKTRLGSKLPIVCAPGGHHRIVGHHGKNTEHFLKCSDWARPLISSHLPAQPLGFEPSGGQYVRKWPTTARVQPLSATMPPNLTPARFATNRLQNDQNLKYFFKSDLLISSDKKYGKLLLT
jgi:hypothetical protein